MDIVEELQGITTNLAQEGVEYALRGGLAMAVYAMPRATLDIDLMIQTDSLDKATRAVEPLGFTISGDPMEFQAGTIRIRRFSKIDAQTAEVLVLAFLLVTERTAPAWESRRDVEWEGASCMSYLREG